MPTVCYANLKSLFQSDFLAPLFISSCKPYEQQFMGYTLMSSANYPSNNSHCTVVMTYE